VSSSLLVLVLLLVGGCGDDAPDDVIDDPGATPRAAPLTAESRLLDSGSFASTKVVGHDLVPDTAIQLGFDGETMSVAAGCNTQFGAFTIEDGVLQWSEEPAATMMMCEDDLVAQDEWLRGLLTTGLAATTDDVSLELTSSDDSVTISMEPVPEVDLESLLGRTWSVVGTLTDETTSRLPERVPTPRLVVGADGLSRLDTGCNTGTTRVSVDRVSISFSPPTTTRVACPEPARTIEQTVLAVVDGRSDHVRFDGSVLVLVKDGAGLVFAVR
jgi:heat shock protein HslJ